MCVPIPGASHVASTNPRCSTAIEDLDEQAGCFDTGSSRSEVAAPRWWWYRIVYSDQGLVIPPSCFSAVNLRLHLVRTVERERSINGMRECVDLLAPKLS